MDRYCVPEELISVERARDMLLARVAVMPVEHVDLDDCYGRVLAQDVISAFDVSAFDRSAMDGFALRSADGQAASPENPVLLHIIGTIGAGSVFTGVLGEGEALRIMTGAPLPEGADAVVMIEHTEVLGVSVDVPGGSEVRIAHAPCSGENVRQRGEEAKAGEVLMRAGNPITLAGLGLLAATGTTQLAVCRRPRVAIFSTGSELVDVSGVPGPGQIRDANSHVLAAAARDVGAVVTVMPRVQDMRGALVATLNAAVTGHDLVVLSGGAAGGDFDFTTSAISELGEVLFDKVCMRPGKAQTLGVINDVPVFGLPGNPGAAMIAFEILVRPALRKMLGFTDVLRPVVSARLTEDVRKKEPLRFYMLAKFRRDADGELVVTPTRNQYSALSPVIKGSSCLLVKPEGGAPLLAGEQVHCVCINVPEGEVV